MTRTTLIDPTCGSGHFLLGAFDRLWQAWHTAEPATSERELAQRALTAVTGVDLNPFAAEIARFRLLVAALKACGIHDLRDAPDFTIDVAVGDSLLWGARSGQFEGMEDSVTTTASERQFFYRTEHAERLSRIFSRQYAAVVGNPPYIVCRDPALNQQYRERYPRSCHRQYSLAAPFMERFFELAVSPDHMSRPAGFVGMITANSFMKREFGKKLIEQCIPTWDLTHVIDTSGAYIPGHGTPTVISSDATRDRCNRQFARSWGSAENPRHRLIRLKDLSGRLSSTRSMSQAAKANSSALETLIARKIRKASMEHRWGRCSRAEGMARPRPRRCD